jgi:hypothetical protein
MGAAALCPHTNTRFFDKTATDKAYLDGTMEMLRRCDAVVMCANFQASQGALAERAEAERLGLPVFYNPADFAQWLDDADPCRLVTPIGQGRAPLRVHYLGGFVAC